MFNDNLHLPKRREFLKSAGLGFGSLALASMLQKDSQADVIPAGPLAPKQPHLPPKVKSIIWLFMTGAPSQVDTWDYKPELQKRDGQELAGSDPKTGFFTTSGKCLKSPFEWKQHGESGSWVPEIFPHLSQHVDKMCFLHSMYLRQNNHAPASIELMCGTNRPGLPALGAWLTYGLGSLNQDLPSYVVMHDTRPRGDDQIWSAGFLPKTYQALALDARRKEAIDNLLRDNKHTDAQQRSQLDLMRQLNQEHAATRPTQTDLAARINSYELAYRMQMAAPEAMDLTKETAATHQQYGLDKPECATFARQCLLARRLVERGVRFVQIFAGKGVGGDGSVNDVPWDCHTDVQTNHRSCGLHTDQPAAALLADLSARGLLESTLVIWGGEFGRTSDSQGAKGRDHNPNGFTIWMAGAGVKAGLHYGATDEFGYKAVENKVHVNDLHATLLHLLGLEHTKLTYRFNGRDFRLTDVAGEVLKEIII
ncbi:hypothetical protein ETAA8_34090 [Anatilimnocola aggregata]|uniref:DUF1501 domain-containing protein n=1 Tax=Anatilimnocola aggregata TaxID=2528021 RepID=A0A517YDN9_9BACT|nr:DUF1501 domain-containing protein [Anatilimnocola aggregata]QDU28309.1 hypothetical protein ETAA8_34090 [Anatilimnocola aggregata]